MLNRALGTILVCLLCQAAPVGADEYAAAPADLDAREVAKRVEDTLRADRTYWRAAMTVVSPRLPAPRVVTFKSWDDRPGKRSFIRILGPPKDAGSGFLKLHPNLWTYVPRVERTMRIPPSMMLQSWMGSDFTNDDLVRESSQLDDYDHRLLGVEDVELGGSVVQAYVLEYVPHEDAPVVWGRIVTWVDAERWTPLRQDFFDEDGERLRTMRFGEIKFVDGRHFPHEWSMTPLDKEGYETSLRIEEIRFDPDLDAEIFTKRHLTRGR